MESLIPIFDRYGSDKNSSFHNYCRQYDTILKDYRQKNISFLEIGVYGGESLKIWRDSFLNAKKIVGIDINPECKKYENIEKSIYVEIGDASDPSFIDYVNQKHGPFDIILDDGSHRNREVILSFEGLFPLMNDNSLYIVEDTITYKHPQSIVPNYENHLYYFIKFIPYLNQWRFDSTQGVRDNCVDPFKIQKKAENIFEASIDMITFGVSFIAIYKKVRSHWL
jgi:hypothetical protein